MHRFRIHLTLRPLPRVRRLLPALLALCCLIHHQPSAPAQDDADRHLGPIVGLASIGETVYSASQGGIFEHSEGHARWILQPPFRVFTLAGRTHPQTKKPILILGGGAPGISGEIAMLDPASGSLVTCRVSDDLVYGVAIHPNGTEVALACADQRVLTMALPALDSSSIHLRHKHTAEARAVAYSADGRHVASGGLDGVLLISTNDSNSEPIVLQEHTAGVECLQFSPDSRLLASGSRDARVRMHSADGRFLRTYSRIGPEAPDSGLGKKPCVWALAWTRDSSALFAGTSRGSLDQLSLTDDSSSQIQSEASGPIFSLQFNTRGQLMIGTEKISTLPPPFRGAGRAYR